MAGPGGGPPRRSHTKSRKGCDTCKRRHIRCDESFPQCRNCTKHKIRCPYNDMPVPEDRSTTPDKPDLLWTPDIEAAIERWQRTGVFPFPDLHIYPAPNPHLLSVEALRLIYHVASISSDMAAIEANGFTLWTRQIPTLIRIGATHEFVMQALLAFSAMHIAFLTGCPLVGNLSYEYRGVALKGLHEAIDTFSRETSDAVLAASLVLSWQATDWRSWTQLMQGTSSIIEAMEAWKHESQFGDFIAESSTFPTAPASPTPDHKPSQPHPDDLEAFSRILAQLQKVEAHLKAHKEDVKPIQQLSGFVKAARKVSTTLTPGSQFERLAPLRSWLFWLPVMLLKQTRASPTALLTIAHYYTVAQLMERLFPEIGAAYFGSLSLGPIEEVARRLFCLHMGSGDLHASLNLMQVPIDVVEEFRSRMGWVHPVRTPSFPQFDPPNFYVSEQVPLPPVSEPSSYLPYENPAFSYSAESLPMLGAPESAPNSAISPLSLSSPFATSASGQYLSIPSPSYAASAYSPTSSIAFSDADEYAFDMGGPSIYHHGGHTASPTSNFGAGFVSPSIQTVWI